MARVGVVGLGIMGGRMAAALKDAGHELTVSDTDPAKVEPVAALGAAVADDPAALAEDTDLVLLSLPFPGTVRTVVAGERGLLAAGTPPRAVVDLSTVDPETTRAMEECARASGVGYLDAPVLGRPDRCGRWTLPVGGDPEVLELARPVLDVLAARITRVGDSGAGHALKLLNNLMFGAINGIVVEIMTVAKRVGVDPATFVDTVAESKAGSVSNLFLQIGPKIVENDTTPTFSLDLLDKDVRLAMDMAESAGTPLIVGDAVRLLDRLGIAQGLGPLDTSALTRFYENAAPDEVASHHLDGEEESHDGR